MIKATQVLRHFLAVAEHGGVHEAARHVHLSQSALTRQIKSLEDELGVALFERTSKGMKLNRFGTIFLHYARQVELNLGYGLSEIQENLDGTLGSLRIGAGVAWSYAIVPDAIAQLQQELPGVRAELHTRVNEFYPMLEAGQLDCLVTELPEKRQPMLAYEEILAIDRRIFSHRSHPLATQRRIPTPTLLHYPWVAFLGSPVGTLALKAYFASAGLAEPPIAVATSSFQSGFQVMRQHAYLMMLPSTLSAVAHERGLVALDIQHTMKGYISGLVYRPEVSRLSPFRRFRELLISLSRHQT